VNAGPEEKRHLGAVGTPHPTGQDKVLVPGVVEKANTVQVLVPEGRRMRTRRSGVRRHFRNREFVPSTFIEATRAGVFFRSNVRTPRRIRGMFVRAALEGGEERGHVRHHIERTRIVVDLLVS